jgi:hypothetical protein
MGPLSVGLVFTTLLLSLGALAFEYAFRGASSFVLEVD